MDFKIIPVTKFHQNCTLLICKKTKKAAVVDPGGDIENILAKVKEYEVTLEKIFLTHGHIDHVGGAQALADQLSLPIEGPHIEDKAWLQMLSTQSEMFSFPPAQGFNPDRWLVQGDQISFGEIALEVYHCPGHTPGHVVFFHPQSKLALVGDVLFKGSIGRTDFPRGNYEDLVRSIREKLFPLGDEVQFVPGHGPMSTFGLERETNPFVGKNI
ncbi:MBL fold metallo-hydrolase [Candidatus Nitrosacidococcus sp. I8]|uniref:MBL fold metallo-hydrolase n=1 Tax=Candidatus Nitrosacidococcus sp. I8 TaxID=2942908 RepID=UPI0022275CE6|nr:MBL fold metallo-hydrolase [Candidatus Nitrosacidococcus sp. I8]CAH9018664.1 Hydroxyacylglutathione hydrolase GloC [Candidatus Nitrosacidococcus sp. I8]